MARVNWKFSSSVYYDDDNVQKMLDNNPVEFYLLDGKPQYEEYKLNGLVTKIVFRKKAGDPRLVLQHKFQLTYPKLDKAGLDVLMMYSRYWNQKINLKLWQFDAKYDSGLADDTGAFLCWPKGDGTYQEYFAPFRNLADDEESRTHVWVNGVEEETGFDIDFDEGKVVFDTPQLATDVVKMHFVWNPRVVMLDLDPRPMPGHVHEAPRFTPIIVMQEV